MMVCIIKSSRVAFQIKRLNNSHLNYPLVLYLNGKEIEASGVSSGK